MDHVLRREYFKLLERVNHGDIRAIEPPYRRLSKRTQCYRLAPNCNCRCDAYSEANLSFEVLKRETGLDFFDSKNKQWAIEEINLLRGDTSNDDVWALVD